MTGDAADVYIKGVAPRKRRVSRNYVVFDKKSCYQVAPRKRRVSRNSYMLNLLTHSNSRAS